MTLPMHQVPPRKPVATVHSGPQFQPYYNGYPQQQYQPHPQAQQFAPHPSVASLAQSRNRTSSLNTVPYMAHQQSQPPPAPYSTGPSPQYNMSVPHNPLSRRLSSATTSTSSTGNHSHAGMNPDIRRSTSSRSGNSQMSYVALLRRQKATVWCDRAQPEDPRLRAQKLVDKKRAYLEVHGAGTGRASTLGSGKGKHGSKVTDISPSALVGATVPVRLSANEVGDDADDDGRSDTGLPYRRTPSGRSSLGSGHRYPGGYQRNTQGTMGSSHSNPPSEKAEERNKDAGSGKDDAATTHSRNSEQEDNFGTVGDMGAPSAATVAAEKAQKAADLRRRGSVDDRTTSMTNVRLFVANPDLSD
ncbi:hypothetical protein BJX61DRAFT_532923 [Aspergillus egyptiacus]|nr:hypothetical protein BJX61DRAFT_532923 [Aspergillus egyptiacus]